MSKPAPKIPSLADVILDLHARQKHLALYIDDQANGDRMAALNLYGQNASRLARMIKMTEALGGSDKAKQLTDAVNEVLTIIESEFSLTTR